MIGLAIFQDALSLILSEFFMSVLLNCLKHPGKIIISILET